MARMEPVYKEFGRRLREARVRADLSQEALGRRVGLTRTSITNIEQGNQRVPLHMFLELAGAVDAEAEALLPHAETSLQLPTTLMRSITALSSNDQAWVRQIVSDAGVAHLAKGRGKR